MNWVTWIVGPQLIGAIFILVGYIQKRFPPKEINNLYGYRMPSAMKNQQTWDEANRYSAICMMRIGLFVLVAGVLVTLLTTYISMPRQTKSVIEYLLVLVSSMGSAIALMVITERHLEKTFDQKQ